ncbi:MAG: tetratricopeptide repeat protein, partial [Nannocystaceae bacterium]
PQLERRAADADDPDDPDDPADTSLTHLTLRPREGAAIAYVRLPEALISLRVAGRDLDPSALAKTRDGGRLLTIWGPPADGLAIDIAAADTTAMNAAWIVADARLGLPEGDRALAEARPPEVVPFQWGDLSVAYREVTPAALAPAPAPADADDCEGCRPTAELDPRRIDAFVDAACHQRYDEARAEFLRFSPTDGDDPRTDAAFAGWVFMVGEKARAREILSALKGAPEAALEVATFTALFARTEGDCAAAKRADKRLMKLLDAAGDAPRPIAWIDFPLAKEIDARALAAWTHGRVLSCGRADPLPAYERALTYDPGFAQAHTQIGDLHFAKERDDAAIAAWRAAIAADPDHANAHSRLGDLLEFRCEFAEALPLLDRAWQLNPFDKGPLTRNLCFAYTRAGRYDDAARACRTYARANPYEDDADELAMMANLLIVAPQAPAATVRDLDAERCGAPPE